MLRDLRQHMWRSDYLRSRETAPAPAPAPPEPPLGPLEGPALQFHESANSMYVPVGL